jgi:hypothetical protein
MEPTRRCRLVFPIGCGCVLAALLGGGPARAQAPRKAVAAPSTDARTTQEAIVPFGEPPANATGSCKDGTYTAAKSPQRGCIGHGGVATWIRRPNTAAPKRR